MSENSSAAIIEQSASHARFEHRDQVLMGFYKSPDKTTTEISREVYDWKYEKYKNAQKRTTDLLKLGYIKQAGSRECKYTKKKAHTYCVTERGLAYLRRKGKVSGVVSSPVEQVQEPVRSDAVGRKGLASVRAALQS